MSLRQLKLGTEVTYERPARRDRERSKLPCETSRTSARAFCHATLCLQAYGQRQRPIRLFAATEEPGDTIMRYTIPV